ncbi:DUF4198 domain-containing protein [Synoicihabitans lomoniglobus]|uniref:DUF4198 domain-containing protein n=1 Tax=Synoicihabitans lomoniglobus TaxID=2909285 RepID=A0AAE9ZWM0_9BACT|nr:DUF4198 domain-containing protein [Opitutaceae bacterium LMO-M01]WED65502.1 DUF4198 domain-containing protein [Opitutaceae bacterium LMO-M01]
MKRSRSTLLAAALTFGAFCVPFSHAHRQWLLPSTTVLSGEGQWVSVEGAVSNNLFFPNHRPIRLESIAVADPDGEPVEIQNAIAGEIRSSFELQLNKPGTYALSIVSSGRRRGPGGMGGGDTLFGSWDDNGQPQRWRGTPESLVTEGMAAKPGFKLQERGGRRLVTFVTCGSPTTKVLEPTGEGFDIEFLTHPNDLYFGEAATFRLLVDGQPATEGEMTVVAGNDRFRNDPGEAIFTADKDGIVTVNWPAPGRYWIEASVSSHGEAHGVPSEKTSTYILILEVLPE